jgi:hypothetical protein
MTTKALDPWRASATCRSGVCRYTPGLLLLDHAHAHAHAHALAVLHLYLYLYVPNAGRKVRFDGNNDELIELAKVNAMALGAGHTFVIFIDEGFPVGDEQH